MRTFAGKPIQLFWQDLKVLEIALTQCKPNLIIELGTGNGASAFYFSLFAKVMTFDNVDKRIVKNGFNSLEFNQEDIFTKKNLEAFKILFQRSDKIFLFCDNGDKPREFETFAPMLKPGDYIAVHDVGLEITQGQIDTVHFKNKLEPVIENLAESERSLVRVFKRGGKNGS